MLSLVSGWMGDLSWSMDDWVVGTISYFSGDEVLDELMRGYAPLLKEKRRE